MPLEPVTEPAAAAKAPPCRAYAVRRATVPFATASITEKYTMDRQSRRRRNSSTEDERRATTWVRHQRAKAAKAKSKAAQSLPAGYLTPSPSFIPPLRLPEATAATAAAPAAVPIAPAASASAATAPPPSVVLIASAASASVATAPAPAAAEFPFPQPMSMAFPRPKPSTAYPAQAEANVQVGGGGRALLAWLGGEGRA